MPPPLRRLVVRIGVSGHRAERLARADVAAIRARVGEVLRVIAGVARAVAAGPASGYDADAPTVRVVSPIAEGADRLVVREALALRDAGVAVELQCPLPFGRDEYERDFTTPASRADYRALLATAGSVLELDGTRDETPGRPPPYEAVGRAVLDRADVLLAVWDGEPERGPGGTGQVVREGVERGLPVVWIDVDDPAGVRLVTGLDGGRPITADIAELPERMRSVLGAGAR